MELLRTQITNTVARIFSHAEANHKQKQIVELSNSPVKTCTLRQVKFKIIWF
jgi:hypothetical protein